MSEIIWEAEEFEYYPKSRGWYWMIVFLAFLLLLLAWWLKSWLMMVVVIVAAIVIVWVGQLRPRVIEIRLNDEKLRWGDKELPWQSIKSFWFVKRGEEIKVNFLPNFRFVPPLSFKIPADKVEAVRHLLQKKAPEEEREESLVDKFNRFLKI